MVTLLVALLSAAATALFAKASAEASARRISHGEFLYSSFLPIWEDLKKMISEFTEAWSVLSGDNYEAMSALDGLDGHFRPWFLNAVSHTDISLLTSVRDDTVPSDAPPDSVIWERSFERLKAYVDTGAESFRLVAGDIDVLAKEMEIRGVDYRAISKASALADSLRQFSEYTLSEDGLSLSFRGWWDSMDIITPAGRIAESMNRRKLSAIQRLPYAVGRDALWLYKFTLHVNRRETLGSRVLRLSAGAFTRMRKISMRVRSAVRRARSEYAADVFYASEPREKLRFGYEAVVVTVARPAVADALTAVAGLATLIETHGLGQSGVRLSFRCKRNVASKVEEKLRRLSSVTQDMWLM